MGTTTNLWPDTDGWAQPQYYTTIQCADVDGDGCAEMLARSSSGIEVADWDREAHVWSMWPAGPAWSDNGNWNQPQYYTTIQCADVDGDGRAEVLARSAAGIEVWQCNLESYQWNELPPGPALSDEVNWNQPQYYTTIQCADIDGDGRAEILARSAAGIKAWQLVGYQWNELPAGPAWSDEVNWNQPQYYTTIQCADINGDGRAEVLARSAAGIEVWQYDPKSQSWSKLPAGPAWSDEVNWNQPQYYTTIQCADINGDGRAEVLARSAAGIEVWQYDPKSQSWSKLPAGPAWSDTLGWTLPQYYSTIQCADIDGDGQANLLGRSSNGLEVWRFVTTSGGQEWVSLSGGPAWSNASGWDAPQYYTTIQCAELDGYGQAEIIGRGSGGMVVYRPEAVTTSKWESVLQKARFDPVYRKIVIINPIEELKKAGIPISEAQQAVVIKLVEFILADRRSGSIAKRAIGTVGDSSYISADANWYGLNIHLSSKAVSDASDGLDILAALTYAISVALTYYEVVLVALFTAPQLTAIVNLIICYLWGLGTLIVLMDRGNGVDLVVPWTSFGGTPPLGTFGLVIPIPR